MSGLSPVIFTASYFISESVSSFIISLVLTIFCRSTHIMTVLDGAHFVYVLVLLWWFLMAVSAVVFAMSSFFTRPATVTQTQSLFL